MSVLELADVPSPLPEGGPKASLGPVVDVGLSVIASFERGHVGPPSPTPPGWRGTFSEAVLESERAAGSRAVYVSADWEKQARVRLTSAPQLVAASEAAMASGVVMAPGEAGRHAHGVREDGTIHNMVTGRDEYLRLDGVHGKYPPKLCEALERQFGAGPSAPMKTKGVASTATTAGAGIARPKGVASEHRFTDPTRNEGEYARVAAADDMRGKFGWRPATDRGADARNGYAGEAMYGQSGGRPPSSSTAPPKPAAQPKPVQPRVNPDAARDVPRIHMGKQLKHIPGHNNFEPGRSVLRADPESLAVRAGTGEQVGKIQVGQAGSKERVVFDNVIGDYVDQTGAATPTRVGVIHYSKDGVHIVPGRPQ